MPKSIVALISLSLVVAAVCPAAASAAPGEYRVEVCTPTSDTGGGTPTLLANEKVEGSGILYTGKDPGGLRIDQCREGKIVEVSPLGAVVPKGGSQSWALFAPVGARINRLGMFETFEAHPLGSRHSFLEWSFLASDSSKAVLLEHHREEGAASFPGPEPIPKSFAINLPVASSHMFCAEGEATTCGQGEFKVTAAEITASVIDGVLPGVSGPLLESRVLRGTVDAGFATLDEGSGVAKAELLVDGHPVATASDENGGKCVTPYKYMQPCELKFDSSFSLDTTTLAEGPHQMTVLATDGSGLTRETPPLDVLVHNAPSGLVRPAIQGSATVGARLEATPGIWAGDPTGFTFRWFRCPASVRGDEGVSACRGIPGAESGSYKTTKEDLGQRDLVEVVATNFAGSETSLSFPTDLIETPHASGGSDKPLISHVKLSPKRFRVGSTLSKKEKRGAVLAFTTSRGGEVSIAIGKRRPRSAPKPVGKLVAKIKAGRNRLLLSGKIGRRRLRPGSYEAIVRVTDPKGTASAPVRVRFTIIPG